MILYQIKMVLFRSPFTPPESPLKKKIGSTPTFSPTETSGKSKIETSGKSKMSNAPIKRVQSINRGFRRSKSIPKFGKGDLENEKIFNIPNLQKSSKT